MKYIYWFDVSALSKLPAEFTVADIRAITGTQPDATWTRVKRAIAEGTVERLNPGARAYLLRFTATATIEDKRRFLALPVREQVRRILRQVPERFSNRHVYPLLPRSDSTFRHRFMEAVHRSGFADPVYPSVSGSRTHWWMRDPRFERMR